MSDYIVLLMGKSGTGKTTLVNKLADDYNWKAVESYTTRPPRYDGEKGHIFVSDKEFDKLKDDMCAYTKFDNYRYCATNKQVDKADIYVIDPAGVKTFLNDYKGRKKIITVELLAQKKIRYKRMRTRGDSFFAAKRRLKHDKKAFAHTESMLTLNGNINNIDDIAKTLMNIVAVYERFNMEMDKCLIDQS